MPFYLALVTDDEITVTAPLAPAQEFLSSTQVEKPGLAFLVFCSEQGCKIMAVQPLPKGIVITRTADVDLDQQTFDRVVATVTDFLERHFSSKGASNG